MKKLIFLLAVSAFAQYPLQEAPYQAIYTANGVALPCVNCLVYTYFAGTVSPQNTYTSHTLGATLPNPVHTNSAGYAVSGSNAVTGIWTAAGSCYHVVLKNAVAVTVFDQDYLCSPASGPGAGTLTGVTAKCGLRAGGTSTVPALSVDGPCWAAGGGTAQVQTATYTTATTLTLVNGLFLCWKPAAANTGAAPTFSPNTLTAHPIVKAGGALVANDIITTAQACAIYNSTGTQWELQNPQTIPVGVNSKTFAINGNGSAISTGALLVFSETETGGTIYKVVTTGTATSGPANCSITVDIWKANAALPTSSDKISASAPATLSSAQLSTDTTLTGWSKTVAAGDIFSGSVATSSGCVSATIQIWWQ